MKRVGRYELERLIGTGGMAEVWLASQRGAFAGASKTVAVKLMAEHLAASAEFQRMFESEVRLSMLLSHSNVVQVFDAGRDDGHTYLVMEWVEGVDLSRLEEHVKQFDVDVAVHIVAEVLRGLAYAHRRELVHRDVSPHNVLVSVSGEVKLTDFGVARLAVDQTTAHDIRGKLRYMAPEQALGRSRSPTVDLYSVGAILHELLAGTRFRDDQDPDALRGAVLRGDVPPLPRAAPPEVEALRQRLLAPDPAYRFQSADEALAAIEQWPGSRRRTEAVALLCRRALEGAMPKAALERTDGRWADVDGTATQTATTADFTRTPSRTVATTAPEPPVTKANVGTAIAILLGSLLAAGGLAAIVAYSLRDGESERDDTVSINGTRSGPISVDGPKPYGRSVPKETPMLERGPKHGKPITPVAGDTEHEDEDEDEDTGDLAELPAEADVRAALEQRDATARECGHPGVARLELELTFVGVSGVVASADVVTQGVDGELRECIEDAYVLAAVPPFRAEIHRVTHFLAYSP